MQLSPYGKSTVIAVTVVTLLILGAALLFQMFWLRVVAGLAVTFTVWVFYFFRDPDRTPPMGEDIIVSPADGTVIRIEPVDEESFVASKAVQVSIFLSIFNVHVNRLPLSGIVKRVDYMKGRFLPAFNHKASIQNEQTIIGIENKQCKIVFKQIAGLLARRIVCNLKEGQSVVKGARFGIIKFGSRVDMIVPKNVRLQVTRGDKVKAGETIIGIIQSSNATQHELEKAASAMELVEQEVALL